MARNATSARRSSRIARETAPLAGTPAARRPADGAPGRRAAGRWRLRRANLERWTSRGRPRGAEGRSGREVAVRASRPARRPERRLRLRRAGAERRPRLSGRGRADGAAQGDAELADGASPVLDAGPDGTSAPLAPMNRQRRRRRSRQRAAEQPVVLGERDLPPCLVEDRQSGPRRILRYGDHDSRRHSNERHWARARSIRTASYARRGTYESRSRACRRGRRPAFSRCACSPEPPR
jgi:hypothetical protein